MSKPLHSPDTYKQKSACGQKGTALRANWENTTEEKGFTYGLNGLPRPPQSLAADVAKSCGDQCKTYLFKAALSNICVQRYYIYLRNASNWKIKRGNP